MLEQKTKNSRMKICIFIGIILSLFIYSHYVNI